MKIMIENHRDADTESLRNAVVILKCTSFLITFLKSCRKKIVIEQEIENVR